MTTLPRLPATPALPTLSVTPQARPGLFKRAIAALLIVTINISAVGQAAAQIIRGPNGAPLTGYTANGTFVQNGQVVGNPHQQLHDLTNPTLWTTAAASFTNSTDPSFTQGTLAEIEAAIAVTPEAGGLALSRLYITVPPTVPLANPYTDPNAGAAGCNAATTCNQAVYNQLLLDAQASGYVPTVDPVSGLSTHIGKTHASSSPEIFDRGFNLYQTKPVFVAAENPAGGATAFFALQGEQAKTHLAHLQQQNAALLGSAIFFSQQRIRGSGTGTSTDWEGNVIDPGAAFDAALGSAPNVPPTYGDTNGFVVGYIKPDGQAHEFQLQHDEHFRQFQSQQAWNGWDGGNGGADLNSLLGQELRTAGIQHQAGEQAANSIDFRGFKEDRALFMQGLDLYRFASGSERELLSRLQNGEIGPGHPQYAAARALAEDKFRGAYAGHVEYNTQFKHTKESAAYQAQQLDLKNIDNDKLFNQGLNLFDKRGDPEQERLLGMLQRGELKEDHPRYQEIRGLAEARFKVAYQKALEPPKKANWLKQLVVVVIAAIVVYFTAGAASGWAAAAIPGATTTATVTVGAGAAAVTTTTTVIATTTVGGIAATAIGSAVGAYAGAVVGAGIQTGSLSKALAAGENSLKGGVAGILVNTAMAAAGIYAGNLGGSLGMSKQVGEAVYSTVTNSLTQSIAYGGSLGDALIGNAINAGVDVVSANVANVIGKETAVGSFEKYAAHAALGCGVGMAKSGSGDGCVPAAAGAVAGHMAADGIKVALSDETNTNPIALMAAAVPGRTLDENVVFWGGLVGGTAAALAGGGNNVQGDFGLGQGAAANAIKNNYLKYDEAKKLQALKEDELKGQCTSNCKAEIQRLETVDRQRNEQLAQCEGSSAAGCQQAFKEVRLAAADYVRKDASWNLPEMLVLQEKNETLKLAQNTTDGKLQGAAQGYWDALKDAAKGLKESGQTLYAAASGDQAAWEKIKQGAGAAADYVSEPENWPYLLGAMTPQEREQLARAYETGNGSEIGRIMGQQIADMPIGGGAIGSIKKIDGVIEAGKTPPYNSIGQRGDLEATHGADNVSSTTVANNPTQRVNSDPAKGIEVISNDSGKAVVVTYKDPVSGESLKANIPYDSRGLPVFDDVSKYTTKIDNSVPYEQQFGKATRDLRDAINSGKVDPKQFTPEQLSDIQKGADKIQDYTWHHNAQSAPNNMQLVPEIIHKPVLHLGQGALSQGK